MFVTKSVATDQGGFFLEFTMISERRKDIM